MWAKEGLKRHRRAEEEEKLRRNGGRRSEAVDTPARNSRTRHGQGLTGRTKAPTKH